MLEVEKKIWDSDFFGFPIGECTIDCNFQEKELDIYKKKFKLFYLYSQQSIENANFQHTSTRAEFLREISKSEIINSSKEIRKVGKSFEEIQMLKNLALLSGEFSRFKTDLNFKNGEFVNLYYEWILKSVKNYQEISTFGYYQDNEILGFITLERKDSVYSIGLLGVAQNQRGKGIGKALVNQCIYEAQKCGIEKLLVVTQGENQAAISLYEKQKFERINYTYIYHLWNT